ncbi:MAG: hypothetical protein V2A63_02915 [Patescibacteria group bacterium]
MKKILTIAAILALVALALLLTEAFLRKPVPGVSFSGAVSDPAEIPDSAVVLD